MVQASHKPDKSLYVSTSGNAVLFTKTGLPSPIDLSSDDNSLNTPIHITRLHSMEGSGEINGVGGSKDGKEETGACNGDNRGLSRQRSQACLERVKQDWNRAIKVLEQGDMLTNLKELAMDLKLDSYPLRSISWRLFLGVLPPATSEWVETVNKQRESYHAHERKVNIDPHKMSELSSHPLSNESSSAWNQYFQDQDLWQIVDQDVTRTWPEEEIFSKVSIRSMMGKILFTHAKAQSRLEYRQGMHELLANIIYMMCVESDRCPVSSDLPEYLRHVLDPDYLEEDAYTLFSELMESCDVWYDGGEEGCYKARTNIRVETPFEKEGIVLGYTALSKKLNKIQGTLLKKFDLELAEYLDSQSISPQVYGIRWVRLLFGREFILQDILLLWDVLFAHGTSLDLIDYIAIAILTAMRDSLLDQDQGDCLLRLMKYPQDMAIRNVINHALHLKNSSWPYTPPAIISPPIIVEKPVIAPPTRENAVADSSATPADDPSLWSEMEVGKPNMGHKPSRAKSNTLSSITQHAALLSKHKTLPGRIRIGKNSHLGVSMSSPNKSHPDSGPISPPVSKSSENQINNLQKEVELLRVKSDYCVGKLTAYVDHLQDILYGCKFENKDKEDFAFLAVAGIKQVRDVLKGQLELGESSFGLDSSMYMYLRESSSSLTEDQPPAPPTPPGGKDAPKGLLKEVQLDDSLDLFTNTSQPITCEAEMVDMRHSPDLLPEQNQSPSHPLESID